MAAERDDNLTAAEREWGATLSAQSGGVCLQAQDLIRLAEGRGGRSRAAWLDHVSACARCRSAYRQLLALERARAAERSWLSGWLAGPGVWRTAAAAAAVVCVAGVALLVGMHGPAPTTGPGRAVAVNPPGQRSHPAVTTPALPPAEPGGTDRGGERVAGKQPATGGIEAGKGTGGTRLARNTGNVPHTEHRERRKTPGGRRRVAEPGTVQVASIAGLTYRGSAVYENGVPVPVLSRQEAESAVSELEARFGRRADKDAAAASPMSAPMGAPMGGARTAPGTTMADGVVEERLGAVRSDTVGAAGGRVTGNRRARDQKPQTDAAKSTGGGAIGGGGFGGGGFGGYGGAARPGPQGPGGGMTAGPAGRAGGPPEPRRELAEAPSLSVGQRGGRAAGMVANGPYSLGRSDGLPLLLAPDPANAGLTVDRPTFRVAGAIPAAVRLSLQAAGPNAQAAAVPPLDVTAVPALGEVDATPAGPLTPDVDYLLTVARPQAAGPGAVPRSHAYRVLNAGAKERVRWALSHRSDAPVASALILYGAGRYADALEALDQAPATAQVKAWRRRVEREVVARRAVR